MHELICGVYCKPLQNESLSHTQPKQTLSTCIYYFKSHTSAASFILNMSSGNLASSESKEIMSQLNTLWQEESHFTLYFFIYFLVWLGISKENFFDLVLFVKKTKTFHLRSLCAATLSHFYWIEEKVISLIEQDTGVLKVLQPLGLEVTTMYTLSF